MAEKVRTPILIVLFVLSMAAMAILAFLDGEMMAGALCSAVGVGIIPVFLRRDS